MAFVRAVRQDVLVFFGTTGTTEREERRAQNSPQKNFAPGTTVVLETTQLGVLCFGDSYKYGLFP